MNEKNSKNKKGMSMKGQRTLAYIVLIIISFFCLFWFYVLFINATRSNGALKKGFTAIPGGHLIENWKNLLAGTLPVWNGMFNSIFIATCSAVLCTYFSTMTAYAIHAYNFKAKKIYVYIYPCSHDDPNSGNCSWIPSAVGKNRSGRLLCPTDRSKYCCSCYFLLYETVHGKQPSSGACGSSTY